MKYLSLVLVSLVCLTGCIPERVYETPKPKFKEGDEIRYKGSNIEGLVIRVVPIRTHSDYSENRWDIVCNSDIDKIYAGVNYYKVAFTTKNQIGIDTAAGSGFLGDTEHYPPTFIVTRYCEEFELEKR